MFLNKRLNVQGLSLIEIVIVLALSGLIITLVFLALPIAQRERRNAQRKEYLHEVAANVEKYKESAASGFQYPVAAGVTPDSFRYNLGSPSGPPGPYHVTGALTDKDPLSGTPYTYAGLNPPSATTPAGILYELGLTCQDGSVTGIYRLKISLEGGTYCLDNH